MKISQLFASLIVAVTLLSSFSFAKECTEEKPCDINFWQIFTGPRGAWAEDAAVRFNELYPEYNVIVEQPGDYYAVFDQYILAQEQGNPPEIVQFFDAGLQYAADSGYFKYADDIINGREEILGQEMNFDDIIEVITSYYTLDGVWASVAWNTSSAISFANMSLLKSVGITEIPQTWGELMVACEALQPLVDAGDIEGCATWPFDNWFTEQWLAQMNQYFVNNENGRAARATQVLLGTDEFLSIANFYQEMYEKGYYVYTGTRRDWTGAGNLFSEGKVAFTISSSSLARAFQDASQRDGWELDSEILMHNEDYGWTGNILGGATLWITDGLEPAIEDGAMAFLLFMNSTENSASWHTASGYVPIRTSSVELLKNIPEENSLLWDTAESTLTNIPVSDWFAANPPFETASIQLANSTVNNATAGAKFGTFVESRTIIETGMEDVMLNSKNPSDVFEKINDELNVLLEEYNFLYE